MMRKTTALQSEFTFTILLGLAFASLFFGQAMTHIVGVLFIFALLIIRPKLPWIRPFWWLLAFVAWEWLSNYFGPYHGDGIEGGGIGYHAILLFLPLCLLTINHSKLLIYITVGAVSSATLIWLQGFVGVDLNATPLRINWDGGDTFSRPPGFNRRAWVTQFIHSFVSLVVLPYVVWSKPRSWLLMIALFSGVILPQIRGVIASFIAAYGVQLVFIKRAVNFKILFQRAAIAGMIAIVFIGAIAILRPDFSNNLLSGNGRDKIFIASLEIFKEYPHTGIGGGEHFKKHYQQAWVDLGWHTDPPSFLESKIGHTHSDYLMLLVHHGWPALFLWLGFLIHCLRFVWQHGSHQERILFTSLVIMHQVAGLAETYLDYSNTTYTILLCYGLALHGPIRRFQSERLS
jgi:hypothetical protein